VTPALKGATEPNPLIPLPNPRGDFCPFLGQEICDFVAYLSYRKEVFHIELTERDFEVLRLVSRFRFMTGKHIKKFANFSSDRTKERRLKLLVDSKYLHREKIFYGYPYFYTLTHKGRMITGLTKHPDKIRVDRIKHDIIVLDCINTILSKYSITLDDITTEKELHRKDGFGNRNHQPDFIFYHNEKSCAVEIELTVKNKDALEKNVKSNYMNYDYQLWFIEKTNKKLNRNLDECTSKYDNIHISYL